MGFSPLFAVTLGVLVLLDLVVAVEAVEIGQIDGKFFPHPEAEILVVDRAGHSLVGAGAVVLEQLDEEGVLFGIIEVGRLAEAAGLGGVGELEAIAEDAAASPGASSRYTVADGDSDPDVVYLANTTNDGSEIWTADGAATTSALVRITSRNLATPVADDSNAVFTLM